MIRCSDITQADKTPVTWWTSADGRGEIDMTGYTASEALAALLGQCTDDEQRARILAGTLTVAPA